MPRAVPVGDFALLVEYLLVTDFSGFLGLFHADKQMACPFGRMLALMRGGPTITAETLVVASADQGPR